jgi:hypothetical protein
VMIPLIKIVINRHSEMMFQMYNLDIQIMTIKLTAKNASHIYALSFMHKIKK